MCACGYLSPQIFHLYDLFLRKRQEFECYFSDYLFHNKTSELFRALLWAHPKSSSVAWIYRINSVNFCCIFLSNTHTHTHVSVVENIVKDILVAELYINGDGTSHSIWHLYLAKKLFFTYVCQIIASIERAGYRRNA